MMSILSNNFTLHVCQIRAYLLEIAEDTWYQLPASSEHARSVDSVPAAIMGLFLVYFCYRNSGSLICWQVAISDLMTQFLKDEMASKLLNSNTVCLLFFLLVWIAKYRFKTYQQ